MFTLDTAGTATETISLPAKSAEIRVGTTGVWTGTLTVEYTVNGVSETYTDGVFTANTDFVFKPASDSTTFTLAGTGSINIEMTVVKWAK